MSAIANLVIDQGGQFDPIFSFLSGSSPTNLTGFTARAQIAAAPGGTPIVTLTSANGGLIMGGSAGTIQLVITATQTAAFPPGVYLWDLLVTDTGGIVRRYLQGSVQVTPRVTT